VMRGSGYLFRFLVMATLLLGLSTSARGGSLDTPRHETRQSDVRPRMFESSVDGKIRRLRRRSKQQATKKRKPKRSESDSSDIAKSNKYKTIPGMSKDAFDLCYTTLQGVAVREKSKVFKSQYLDFLNQISNGAVSHDKWSNLPEPYTSIFYDATCAGKSCKGHRKDQYISAVLEGMNVFVLRNFCYRIMSNVYTSVDVSFEFTIRYDSEIIPESKLPPCLSKATENLLLDHFGCESTQRVRRQGRQRKLLSSSEINLPYREERTDLEREIDQGDGTSRELFLRQKPNGSSSDDFSNGGVCPYSVENNVYAMRDFRKRRMLP